MHLTSGQKAERAAKKRHTQKSSHTHRKYGRKHRNGKPFRRNGDCGCEFCRRRR